MFNWLFRNLRTFFLALMLALAVWVSAVTTDDPDEVRSYPRPVTLEVIGQDPSLVITGSLPERVSLTLRAPRSVWNELTASEGHVRAILDLSGLSAGQHTVEIQLQVDARPVRVVSLSPQVLDVNLEPLATRSFIVQVSLRGEPAVGYKAGNVAISPRQVTISGPQSIVEQVSSISTDLNIAGVRQDIKSSPTLRILNSSGLPVTGLSVSPETVQIDVPVTQQGGYRDIAVKVNVRGQVAGGYRLTNVSVFPPVLTVYSQNPALVNDLPGIVETEPLNLNGAQDNIDMRLGLVLPAGVEVIGEQTVQVQVGISAIEGSLSLTGIPIEILGLGPGLEATVSPATVDVILTGPLPVLDKLTPSEIKFIIDLTGLQVGTHQVTPRSEILITDIQVQSLIPATIEVTIKLNGSTPTLIP